MSRASKLSGKNFEPRKKNPVSLGSDSNIDNDFKSFRIGEIPTGLEFKLGEIRSTANNFVTLKETTEELFVTKIKGNKSGSTTEANFMFQNAEPTEDSYGLWFNIMQNGSAFIDARGSNAGMFLECDTAIVFTMGDDSSNSFRFRYGNTWDAVTNLMNIGHGGDLTLYSTSNSNDYFKVDVGAEGATTISTVDADTSVAHLTLDADGNTIISIADGNESGGAFHITPTGATNRAFSMWGEVDNTTTFLMYEMGGASTSDYFKMETSEHGATTISTVDGASSNAHLTLQPDGDLKLDPASQKTIINSSDKLFFDGGTHTYINEATADLLNFHVGGQNLMAIEENASTSVAQSSRVYTGCPIYLRDIGGVSDTPPSNYGSLYVNADELFYKNDSGTVNRLDIAGKFFLNIGCYYATSIKKWLPLAQGEYDQTTYPIDYATDNANFVVPYDMKINTIYVNHNRALSTTAQPGNTDIQLYKGGSAYSGNVTVNIDGSGYDATNTAVVYTFDFSGETNTFSAGQVMAISLDPTNTAYWFAITICGEYV